MIRRRKGRLKMAEGKKREERQTECTLEVEEATLKEASGLATYEEKGASHRQKGRTKNREKRK